MLQQLKSLYRKFDSGTALLRRRLRARDVQLAQLRAAIAELALGSEGASAEQRQAAKQRLEEMLAHQASAIEESERLLALYESAIVRVAAVEAEISKLQSRLHGLEVQLKGQALGDDQ